MVKLQSCYLLSCCCKGFTAHSSPLKRQTTGSTLQIGNMQPRPSILISICFFLITVVCLFQAHAGDDEATQHNNFAYTSSPFTTALEILQKQINYSFQNVYLLRRAMTHASFSEENNKALSILGNGVIQASLSLRYLENDIDMSPKILNQKIADISDVDNSCAMYGIQLRLHRVVRVSPKTNSSSPSVVCGAFRAMFGAIALDTGKADDAGDVFWNFHGDSLGIAAAW